jgi:hypothetical protein
VIFRESVVGAKYFAAVVAPEGKALSLLLTKMALHPQGGVLVS